MKNNFDLKGYMKENKVGSYQQLNEMWYQDITQALGDFNVIKEEAVEETPLHPDTEEDENGNTYFTEDEMEEGKNAKFFVDSDDSWDTEAESWQATLAKKGIKTKITATMGGYEIALADASQKPALEKWLSRLNLTLDPYDLEEMGGVKTIGDAGKMATPNSRPNLGRHRSSDMLDKMSKKDHKTNTVVGAKAAAYKAPHMKEEETYEMEMFGAETQSSGLQSYIEDLGPSPSVEDLLNYYQENGLAAEEMQELMNHYGFTVQQLASVFKALKMNMLDKMNKKGRDKKMYEEEDIFAGSDTADWNGKAERMDWEKDLVGKEVGNWKSDIEQQAGSISWTSEKYPNAIIYATPGWEGVDGIAVEVHESEEGFLDEPKLQKVVAAGTDLWKTKEGYLALMAKIFTTLEKMLTPAEEMAEDHGTQINHDFNDDISMDYTEPEHMLQNEGVQDWNHTWEEDIVDLLDDGVSKPEILTHFTDILKIARTSMEESIEDEDPFGSIKGGIDKITMGDDDMDMSDDDRMMSLGGDRIKAGIESLMADGFDYREILQFVKDTIAAKRNF